MAEITHSIAHPDGGGLDLTVGDGSTYGEVHIEDADGAEMTAMVGGRHLMNVAASMAAIAQGLTLDEVDIPLYSGHVDYGTPSSGRMLLTPTDGACIVRLWGETDDGQGVAVEVELDSLAEFAAACSAGAHGL